MTKKILLLLFLVSSFSFTNTTEMKKRKEVVFCLDLSGSTNGLINDIRDNLWRFINFSLKRDPGTDLRIGIVVYGRPSFGAQNDYVKILSDLTDNYDYLSQELIKLKPDIEWGQQRLPSAIYAACKNISWSEGGNSKKMIFLFGNGSVPTMNTNFVKACNIAQEKNIVINPVYCVQRNIIVRELPGYKMLADRTGGSFNMYPLSHHSPVTNWSDKALHLKQLNENLNSTYLYCTPDGAVRYNTMLNADNDKVITNEQFVYSRCAYKISDVYQQKCADWDLISFMKNKIPDFLLLKQAYLPKEFQQTSPQDLYETAMHIRQKRNKILSDINSFYATLHINDTLSTNPIDTIVFTALR
jgi:hypothetical protein